MSEKLFITNLNFPIEKLDVGDILVFLPSKDKQVWWLIYEIDHEKNSLSRKVVYDNRSNEPGIKDIEIMTDWSEYLRFYFSSEWKSERKIKVWKHGH